MSSNPTFVNDMNLFGSHIKQIPCIVGEGSPTSDTYGAVGMLYMDSSSGNGEMYKCVKVEDDKYTWMKLVSEDNGENVELDTTLTQSGKAADAKATGNALSGKVGGIGINTIMRITQAEYDALPEKDEATLYIIADAAQVEPDTGMVPYLHIAAPCDIDTGITPTVDTAVEVTFYDVDYKNNNGYIGSWKYQISGQGQPWLGALIGDATFSVNINNFSNTGVKNTFRLDKSGLYINGELAQAATATPTFNPTTKLHLFLAWNTVAYKDLAPGCWLDDAKFYGAKIWQGGELVRDIVPAVDSGGVACVYDKVSGTYLYKTATNTGTLTYSEEVDE